MPFVHSFILFFKEKADKTNATSDKNEE